MRKRRTVSGNNKRSTKRRKVEPNEDANVDPSETIIINDPISDWANIPSDILGNLIFKYFEFNYWLRALSFVNKQWYQAAIRSNADKQLFVYGSSWPEDKNLQKYCIIASRYRVSTIVLRMKKISLGRLAGLLSSSPKLHTFVYTHRPVIDACYQESTLKFPFIKTAFIHSDLLERFPNATRVQLFDEHLPAFPEQLRLPNVEELAVQEANNVADVLKTFPSLKVLHVHTLTNQKSPPKRLRKFEIRISSITNNQNWRKHYSLNQTWGNNIEKTVLDHGVECMETKYTAKNSHQSIEYEVSLLYRNEEYQFPAITESLKDVFADRFNAPPVIIIFCKHMDLDSELLWLLLKNMKKELIQFLKKNAMALNNIITTIHFAGMLRAVTATNLKKIFTKEQLAEWMKLNDRFGTIVHNLIREGVNPEDLERAIKNYGPLPDNWLNDWTLEKVAGRKARYDWMKYFINRGAKIDITTFFDGTYQVVEDKNNYNMEEVQSVIQLYHRKNTYSSKTDWLFESDWNVLSTTHQIQFLDFLVKEFDINLNEAKQENKTRTDYGISFINFMIERMKGVANLQLISEVCTKFKIDLERVDDKKSNPLLTAISQQMPELAIWLLEKGVSPNSPAALIPLCAAVTQHCHDKIAYEFIDVLLAYGADINRFCTGNTNAQNWTPLMAAASKSPVEVVKYLVMRGAKADLEDANGHTALHYVMQKLYHSEAIEFLIQCIDVNKPDKEGLSPLHIAIKNQYNVKVVTALLKSGADVNQVQPQTLKTPPMIAMEAYDIRYLEEVLKFNVDLKARDIKGQSLVYYLIRGFKSSYTFGSKEATLSLIGHLMTADNIAFVIAESKKVLEQAKKSPRLLEQIFELCTSTQYFAEFLIDHVGFDINTQDNDGNVLLSYPMNEETFMYLMTKNPNVNIKNITGKTPLMELTKRQNPKPTQKMLDALIEQGNKRKH